MAPRHITFVVSFVLLLGFGLSAHAQTHATVPAFTRTIYLIRHGAYDMPIEGDEEKINALTRLGIAQARLIAARLRGMPVEFTSLISSTFTRACQTADVINQSLPQLKHETTKLLCECLPPTRVPQNRSDATADKIAAAAQQLDVAFTQYFIPATDHDQHDILVCHGNVIRYFVMKALNVDTQAWLGLSVAHCSLTLIQVKGDGSFKVLAVGDSGHLPPNLVSGLTRNEPQLVAP